jgi:thiamine-phosphate pyrophosphorylase
MLPRPLICLVTDRRRLAERLGLHPDSADTAASLLELVGQAAAADIPLVQVRENDLGGRVLADLVRRCLAVVRASHSRIIVNDRLDVALATGAAGVHLKDGSIAVSRVRALAPPGFLVGESVHDPGQAAESQADYVVFGTVFSTRSKSTDRPLAGLTGLRQAARARVPVLAIGGIDRSRLVEVAKAGAAGVAGVDLFLPPASGLVAPLREVSALVRQAFDSAGSVP